MHPGFSFIPLLFWFWTVLAVILTVNVVRPLSSRRRHGPLRMLLGFASGWLVGDMAPQWIVLNMGILLLFAKASSLGIPSLIAGCILHLFCWLTLFLRLRLLLDLPERIEKQLVGQLGWPFRRTHAKRGPPRTFRQVDWKSWWFPHSVYRDPRVEIEWDREFPAGSGLTLPLDVYRPIDTRGNSPVLIQIHGGGWTVGSSRQAAPLMMRMALRGWTCFSLGYRLSPGALLPDQLADCKRAIRWIRENAGHYLVDPNALFVTGGSAGGHLAMLCALTVNRPEFQPGFEDADTQLQGGVAFYGVYDLESAFNPQTPYPAKARLLRFVTGGSPQTSPERFRSASPSNWISTDSPPFMLVQGGTDSLIPMDEAERFFNKLKEEAKQPCAFLRVPLAEHAFDIFPTLTAQCVLPFVERYLVLLHQTVLSGACPGTPSERAEPACEN